MKPTTKDELVRGINAFWDTVDENKCCHYINHLNKVIPRMEKQLDIEHCHNDCNTYCFLLSHFIFVSGDVSVLSGLRNFEMAN